MLLKDCLPYLLYQFKSEHDLIEAIREVSQKFTTDRQNINDYLKDARLSSAYTAFYLLTNIPKWEAVMNWMPSEWRKLIKNAPFVDVGSGPGTFSLAFRSWAGADFNGAWQLETSAVMREQARRLWDGLGQGPMQQLTTPRKIPGSLLVFGHSANEMGAQEALHYIHELRPDHVLFIEPGIKAFFSEMLKIRSALLQDQYHVLFPCPSNHECPMSKRPQDWCHQFVEVRHDPEVERLSQILHLDRKLLPLTVHAYSRTFRHQEQERLVRVFAPTKFSLEWEVCLGNELKRYQLMKKDFTKQQQKALTEVKAGAALTTLTDKEFADFRRIKLIKINNSSDY